TESGSRRSVLSIGLMGSPMLSLLTGSPPLCGAELHAKSAAHTMTRTRCFIILKNYRLSCDPKTSALMGGITNAFGSITDVSVLSTTVASNKHTQVVFGGSEYGSSSSLRLNRANNCE